MSRIVQIGSKVFEIPDEGETDGWGEDLTEMFVAIADALGSVQGPNDVLLTSALLTNNQTVAAIIPGLSFNVGAVQGVRVEYTVQRIYDSGSSSITEYGLVIGSYDRN